MKILLDANISYRLKNNLKSYFSEIDHVDNILVIPAKDFEIWEYALLREYTIITNDDDFIYLSEINGFPPKCIILKMGNQSNTNLANILIENIENIYAFILNEDYGVLELF